jgi:hypothetical protein
MSTATYQRLGNDTPSGAVIGAPHGIEMARSYAAALRDTNEHFQRLHAACSSTGALQIEDAHVSTAARELGDVAAALANAKGPWFSQRLTDVRRLFLWYRIELEEWTGGPGLPTFLVALLAAIVPFGAVLLLSALVSAPPSIAIPASAVPSLLIFVGITSLVSSLSFIEAQREYAALLALHDARRNRVAALSAHYRELKRKLARFEELRDLRRDFEATRDRLEELQRFFNDRRNQLLLCQYRELRGIPFEQFLVQIFEALGYAVSTTRTTGDQGVDLVVAKGPHRLAIQAKGYSGSVGNDAVQQAFAGQAFYQCTGCVVITNSWFTPSAQELAGRVNCLLIDGDRLPELISGRVL